MNKYYELKSIGHYYCPVTEELFPINSDGTPDLENGLPVAELDEANGISAFDLGKLELLIDHSEED